MHTKPYLILAHNCTQARNYTLFSLPGGIAAGAAFILAASGLMLSLGTLGAAVSDAPSPTVLSFIGGIAPGAFFLGVPALVPGRQLQFLGSISGASCFFAAGTASGGALNAAPRTSSTGGGAG